MEYAVLGLGDSNLLLDRQTTTAKDCNQAAQVIDSALAALGAHKICQRGEADDRTGLDDDVKPWIETLCSALVGILPPTKPFTPAISALSGNGTSSVEVDATKLTGSAAILARMRKDRAHIKKKDADSLSRDSPTVVVAYGSQTVGLLCLRKLRKKKGEEWGTDFLKKWPLSRYFFFVVLRY